MRSLASHDKIQPIYEDDESNLGYRSIPKDATTKALPKLGSTISFIDLWHELFIDHYNSRCDAYVNDIK